MCSNITQQFQKELLRKQILEKRNSTPIKFIQTKSKTIYKKFLSISGTLKKSNYSLYLSINNEVDTKSILNYLNKADKNIYLPTYFKNDWLLAKFTAWNNLERERFGILQPEEKLVIDPGEIDVVVFPGIAFDLFGNRLGHGTGIYDRLFCNSKAIKIGLAFEEQIIEKIPSFSHDLKMHYIVTEKRIINCQLFNG